MSFSYLPAFLFIGELAYFLLCFPYGELLIDTTPPKTQGQPL